MSNARQGKRSWRRIALLLLSAVLVALLAAGVAVAGSIEGWWRTPVAPPGDSKAFLSAAIAEIDTQAHGNAALVLLEHGKPVGEHFVSKGKPVGRDTLFQVASLSKWIAAFGVMRLVDQGKLDLDAPVSKYLTRWHLPKSAFDNDGVTVRRLLSHTAGLTDGLGYGGFPPGTPVQPIEASLTHAADASPGRDCRVRVGTAPGSGFQYSGGGFTLLQLLIEEVSGRPFNDYMRAEILRPLGMVHSTFILGPGDEAGVAQFFDSDGAKATHYRFTALAAASLYTSVADLTRFIQAQLPGPNGEVPGRGVLKPQTLLAMRAPQASQYGAEIWGLGTILYASNNAGGYVVGHDGNNAPAINTAARFDPATGDGIVLLETGNELLASRIAGDWIFWRFGNIDLITVLAEFRHMATTALIAAGVAFLLTLALGWRFTRRRAQAPPPQAPNPA